VKLTPASIKTLALPAGVSEKTHFDDLLPGFGVRVRASGAMGYVVQYKVHGKNRRVVLGPVESLDLGKARASAKDVLAAVRLGRDPAGERLEQQRKVASAFGLLLPRYLERQRSRLKPRSFIETNRHLTAHAKPLHALAVEAIDRRTIAILLGDIATKSGPFASNRVRASLSGFYAWLLREGIVGANPILATNEAIEAPPRTRVLSDDELAQIWNATENSDPYGAIVRLLMLTGARREEVGGLRWSEVDLDQALIVLPSERTKNRRPHQIPLAPAAFAVLAAQKRRVNPDGSPRDFVFGRGEGGWKNWSACKDELNARIHPPISGWNLHDFRRSLSTALHERFDVQPHVVESVLGHVGGHLSGVSGIYNRSSYLDVRRIALQRWADHVVGLAAGERSSVVVMLRRS
jgi:integrase